jgi:radical SAM protein with 4Fe4S-binding SPASM domain
MFVIIMKEQRSIHEFRTPRIDDVFPAKEDTHAFETRFNVRLREWGCHDCRVFRCCRGGESAKQVHKPSYKRSKALIDVKVTKRGSVLWCS